MNRLVCGIGFNDGKYLSKVNGKAPREYVAWGHMLLRCTEKYWEKKPTYTGTTCSNNFKNYSYFYEWCHRQVGFGNKDEKGNVWHLDKDILIKSSKVYDESVCIFIPARINSLLTKRDYARGDFPIGVSWHEKSKKFHARCCYGVGGKTKHIGYFNTQQEAFQAYKTFKEALIKDVANEYRAQLDTRAYQALMKYEVNIND